ncbi:GHMP family kinase ATP-binding protein [Natronincola ferrireducens]|uniref:Threonine kinase n=1 Tax=Natronincola ferrireducens TaxID=393762 RepID=A0A1G8WRF2_9FIRM|nr:hypothetical protein [Natronincola ferrireducens]SDJ80854.1 threonine kinase [Natronincola ferrireducens]
MIQGVCPASCGELLQGYIEGGEKLISYSINLFSKVTIREDIHTPAEKIPAAYSKAYRMLEKVFAYYGYKKKDYQQVRIHINSSIPIAKGMASSTADLAATAIATATYLGKELSEEEVAKLCIDIEPTDSTVFSKITLFDHLKGGVKRQYSNLPPCRVLVLEGKATINTIDFRKIDRTEILKENEGRLMEGLALLEKGIKTGDLKTIGKAATISSFANEGILPKEGLEEIHHISEAVGAYGINVAHSGSVIGILYNDKDFDTEKFFHSLKEKDFMKNYLSIVSYEIIAGGGRIIKP